MAEFRYIVSGPSDGPGNMAADEALFTGLSRGTSGTPVIRVYHWQNRCMTIGYFQKYADFEGLGLEITRRLTGGLSVTHGRDVSYCFALPAQAWPCIYDQTKTYQLIHEGIREGLAALGKTTEFYASAATSSAGGICVQTLYPYDLLYKGRKIVGSCQRRRGTVLLVQGSLHLPSPEAYEALTAALKGGWEKALSASLSASTLTAGECAISDEILGSRYRQDSWNRKF